MTGGPLRGGPLVIAYGNVLRSDDGAAHLTAELLAADPTFPGSVLTAHQLEPDTIDVIAASGVVVFVDARTPDGSGEIDIKRVEPQASGHPSMGHHISPAYVLGLADALYGRVPAAWLVTIPTENFDFGEGLSSTATAGAEAAAAAVYDIVAQSYRTDILTCTS